jgi:hypothetical protein
MYALTSLVLDHTEAYRFAVAPTVPWRWPPSPGWNDEVVAAAREWRTGLDRKGAKPPRAVLSLYDIVTRRRDTSLAALRSGADGELASALLTLHAIADETGSDLLTGGTGAVGASGRFEQEAWGLLESSGSFAHLVPSRIRVLPKTRVPRRGLTIRSFSRHFALSYEAVAIDWQRMLPTRRLPPERQFNVVLLPWPLSVQASDFRAVRGPVDNMDPSAFGFFDFAPAAALPHELLAAVLEAARMHVRRLDVVVLPEAAVDASELPGLEAVLEAYGASSLITGVREHRPGEPFGSNRLHVAMRGGDGWRHISQAKHHRWCLDGPQIRQYHLSRVLDPERQWWESIELPARRIEMIDAGGGATVAPLICEDLARIDEVADIVRRVGPAFVIAVLLDGPQLRTRWPCRYASILADDPGSAVMTLTSLGMALRSRPPNTSPSRVIASWCDPTTGTRELELEPGATGLLLTASTQRGDTWTADGRRHRGSTVDFRLASVRQLALRSRTRQAR